MDLQICYLKRFKCRFVIIQDEIYLHFNVLLILLAH